MPPRPDSQCWPTSHGWPWACQGRRSRGWGRPTDTRVVGPGQGSQSNPTRHRRKLAGNVQHGVGPLLQPRPWTARPSPGPPPPHSCAAGMCPRPWGPPRARCWRWTQGSPPYLRLGRGALRLGTQGKEMTRPSWAWKVGAGALAQVGTPTSAGRTRDMYIQNFSGDACVGTCPKAGGGRGWGGRGETKATN